MAKVLVLSLVAVLTINVPSIKCQQNERKYQEVNELPVVDQNGTGNLTSETTSLPFSLLKMNAELQNETDQLIQLVNKLEAVPYKFKPLTKVAGDAKHNSTKILHRDADGLKVVTNNNSSGTENYNNRVTNLPFPLLKMVAELRNETDQLIQLVNKLEAVPYKFKPLTKIAGDAKHNSAKVIDEDGDGLKDPIKSSNGTKDDDKRYYTLPARGIKYKSSGLIKMDKNLRNETAQLIQLVNQLKVVPHDFRPLTNGPGLQGKRQSLRKDSVTEKNVWYYDHESWMDDDTTTSVDPDLRTFSQTSIPQKYQARFKMATNKALATETTAKNYEESDLVTERNLQKTYSREVKEDTEKTDEPDMKKDLLQESFVELWKNKKVIAQNIFTELASEASKQSPMNHEGVEEFEQEDIQRKEEEDTINNRTEEDDAPLEWELDPAVLLKVSNTEEIEAPLRILIKKKPKHKTRTLQNEEGNQIDEKKIRIANRTRNRKIRIKI